MELTTVLWLFGLVEIGLRVFSGNHLSLLVPLFYILFGTVMVARRIALATTHRYLRRKAERTNTPRRVLMPIESPVDYISRFRLKPLEVVLSHAGERAIRIDLARHHTLVAGMTGFGKTNFINLIMTQLFAKGTAFTNVCEVYLFDLKGEEEDFLHLWGSIPGVHYISLTGDGNIQQAIEILDELARTAHYGKKGRHILVVIDEAAALTTQVHDRHLKSWSKSTLITLAQKLRSRGTLLLATQHPRSDVIDAAITNNMDRKIGFHVDGDTPFDVIFRRRPQRGERLPQQPGEFLLREPGRRGLQFGKMMRVNLPGDVDRVIFGVLSARGIEDKRVHFLGQVIAGLRVGASLPGINKIAKKGSSELSPADVTVYYRNYANASILEAPTAKGQAYTLKVRPEQSYDLLRQFISAGKWQQSPPAFIQKGETGDDN